MCLHPFWWRNRCPWVEKCKQICWLLSPLLSSSSLPTTRSSLHLSLSLYSSSSILKAIWLLEEVCKTLSHCAIFISVKMLDQKWGNHSQIYHLEGPVQDEIARLLAQKAEEKNTVKVLKYKTFSSKSSLLFIKHNRVIQMAKK